VTVTLTFWGTRGSIPVSGPATARTGGSTPCVTLEAPDAPLTILDAGTGIRALGASIGDRPLTGGQLLISHTHWDHIQGLPFFTPLWHQGTSLTIAGPRPERASLASVLERQMEADVFPVPFAQFAEPPQVREVATAPFELPGYVVSPFRLNHPGVTFGYRLERPAMGSFAYVTDNELGPGHNFSPSWRDQLGTWVAGVHTLVHDAMYLDHELAGRRGWGHSTASEAVALAADAGAARLVLFHHDPGRSDDAVDAMVASTRALAARRAPGLEVLVACDGLVLQL
jgi:phosphoribosyl 1,2-cyclic phosphodiesterase